MKKSIATIMLIVLAGCAVTYPQSASEMRDLSKTDITLGSKSAIVSKSPSAVNSMLRRISSQCYNKIINSEVPAGPNGAYSMIRKVKLSSTIRSQGNTTTLAVRMENPNRAYSANPAAPKERFVWLVIDSRPVSGGTQITVYGIKFSLKNHLDNIVNSIDTGRVRCYITSL